MNLLLHLLHSCNNLYSTVKGQSKKGNPGYTRRNKTKQKHNAICVGYHYAQTNTNNI